LLLIKKEQLTRETSDIDDKIIKNKTQENETDQANQKEKKEIILKNLESLNQDIKNLESELRDLNEKKEAEKNQIFDYQKNIQKRRQRIQVEQQSLPT
jgi:predicted  nucleic acid-binding Zn-ribbon protein